MFQNKYKYFYRLQKSIFDGVVSTITWVEHQTQGVWISRRSDDLTNWDKTRAWWKRQPDVDRRPVENLSLVDVDQLKTSVWKPQYGLNYSYLALALALALA